MMWAGVTKIRRIFYAILVLLLFGTPVGVNAQTQPVQARVKLEVQYGFDNTIKSNESVPVRVNVECLSGTVSGNIKIEIPVEAEGNLNASIWMSDVDGRNNKKQCYIWEREIFLEKGDKKEEIFYIELPMYESYINVSVVSEDNVLEFQQIHCDYAENDSYYSESFDEIPLKEKIPIGKYIFIIVLYLIVIGPGLFWVLKGKKEPYWLIGSVCAMSVLFMFLIYLMGRSINMSNPAICHQTIYTQEGEYMHESTDFSVQAYQMQNFVLYFDTDYQIIPKSIGINGSKKVDVQSAETITFQQTEEKTEVILQNISAYRKKCFSMEKYTKMDQEEQLTFQIRGTGDALQIDWKNPTEYHLKEAVVVLKNRIAVIGDIKPFSHGSIEDAKLYSYSGNGMSLLLNDLLDFSEYTFPKYEIENLANVIWKNMYEPENADEFSFVIGLLEKETTAFAANPGFEVYGTSLMKLDVEIDWKHGQTMWCPNLETEGTVYKGKYSTNTNLLHSKEAIVNYETSQVGILKSLEFFYPDYSSQENLALFEGKIYLFNWKTGRFTEVMFWNRQFYDIPLEQYISDTGVLRIYYAMDEQNIASDDSYILPCMKISGKVE